MSFSRLFDMPVKETYKRVFRNLKKNVKYITYSRTLSEMKLKIKWNYERDIIVQSIINNTQTQNDENYVHSSYC